MTPLPNPIPIANGCLTKPTGKPDDYKVLRGRSPLLTFQIDKEWTRSNLELFEEIDQRGLSDDQLAEVLKDLQTEDFHWEWTKKSMLYRADRYEWFYLYAQELPQAACLIYQPEKSTLHTKGNIFYIEYLAVAPWNRSCSVRPRKYKSVGTTLLKEILQYCVKHLGLTPGFCLHSLPQAEGYYRDKMRMISNSSLNKDSLLYFEMSMDEANKIIHAA